MNTEIDLLERLDQYIKGIMDAEGAALLEQQMKSDPIFRQKVEEHLKFIETLKSHARRTHLKDTLEEFHRQIESHALADEVRISGGDSIHLPVWRKYLPLTAVAASVALISILGTLFITQSIETKQTAYYKELRGNVEQIKKSQSLLMDNLAESKKKFEPTPPTYTGTGFLISSNGYVATSHHVIKDADSVYIENETFGRLKTTVLYTDAANDVSILKMEESGTALLGNSLPYVINSAEANLGEQVFTLGFPREDIVYGEGSVSASSGYRQNPNAYQISVPVNPGNSGGPLFNTKGDVIGIISGLQTETSGAAFAIKSAALLEVLKKIPSDTLHKPVTLPKQSLLKNQSRVQQVKKGKEYVFIVRVYNH